MARTSFDADWKCDECERVVRGESAPRQWLRVYIKCAPGREGKVGFLGYACTEHCMKQMIDRFYAKRLTFEEMECAAKFVCDWCAKCKWETELFDHKEDCPKLRDN